MLRVALCSAATLVLCAGLLRADDKSTKSTNKNDKKHEATIVKVDKANGNVTVRMKGENGKEEEKTFKLTGDVRMWDSEGRVATIVFFRSGNDVLVVEREGKLVEMKPHQKGQKENASTNKEKKPGEK